LTDQVTKIAVKIIVNAFKTLSGESLLCKKRSQGLRGQRKGKKLKVKRAQECNVLLVGGLWSIAKSKEESGKRGRKNKDNQKRETKRKLAL